MPDIEWRIGDETGEETIRRTTPRRPRRRKWIMLIVVALGIGLGIAYRSIPGPPRPTPTPLPTVPPTPTQSAMPVKLYETIDREAQALADGDVEAILAVHMPEDQAGTAWNRPTFEPWGHPADNGPLYTIIAFDLYTATRAWADIRQFRNGRSFRETRFYIWYNGRWLRSQPGILFWGNSGESWHTPHFDVIYAVEDRDLIAPVVQQLEEDYQSLCRDLGCASAGHEMTFTVKMSLDTPYSYFPIGESSELRFPSPRVTGIFESGRAYDWTNTDELWTLGELMAQRVAYGKAGYDQPGFVITLGSATWAVERIDPPPDRFMGTLDHRDQISPLPLEKLWEPLNNSDLEQTSLQANLLVHFVEQEYGAPSIARLLKAIGVSKSLSEAIETGLGVPFGEFDQKWRTWLKSHTQ